jgi:hypothetical protein
MSAAYAKLTPEAKGLLADLEERRRASCNCAATLDAKAQVHAADYVIRAVTGEVLADEDVKLCMEHAFEEVG